MSLKSERPLSAVFEVSNVSKSYGTEQAVSSLNLKIPSGLTTVLIGPSGCGKSTTIRLLNGLLQPDSGTVCFEGTEITPGNILRLRQRMGYVIQDGGLFPHLTARENVTLMAQYLKWKKSRTEGRLCELAELTQFPKDGLERYPLQLSGGQQQRVALMRALMLDPGVLLLDEPLGALDPIIRSDLQEDLKKIFQKLGKTVVLVTHDIGEAGFLGDHIVLMRRGCIVQQGTIKELVYKPTGPYVTRFISAQSSLLEVLKGDGS
ncbi:MAG: ATP-binding cassette domain-containing protein [Candidatus Brocadiaceae bacterium]|nr:ATP-binding cassette domain-containing protein [Candidatus Brocadiaceae bacterium]